MRSISKTLILPPPPRADESQASPTPLLPCFLEVLILGDLQPKCPEVLIIGDLLARLLILLDFKSFIISDLIKNEGFAEVLILGGLGRAVGTGGWRRAGGTRRGDSSRGAELLRAGAAWK